MFDEVEEIGFDNNSNIVKQSQTLPTEIQQSINSIVNDKQSDEVKKEKDQNKRQKLYSTKEKENRR